MEGIWKRLLRIGDSTGITVDKNIRREFGVGDEVFVDFKEFKKGKKKNEKAIKKDINS